MNELTMEQKLKVAKRASKEGGFTVYAYSNGEEIKLEVERKELENYWVCGIFENGHLVQA